ncbi:histone H1-like protein HC2 [Heterodontus francisci]|uniref:histone H1-like protein HC2 n=1 Tax=Heterodontus francisci TaxID=7792 RepID=UPI00355BA2B6
MRIELPTAAELYSTAICNLMARHIPHSTITIKVGDQTWFNEECRVDDSSQTPPECISYFDSLRVTSRKKIVTKKVSSKKTAAKKVSSKKTATPKKAVKKATLPKKSPAKNANKAKRATGGKPPKKVQSSRGGKKPKAAKAQKAAPGKKSVFRPPVFVIIGDKGRISMFYAEL